MSEPEQISRPLGELMAAIAANRHIDDAMLRKQLERDVYLETVEATGIDPLAEGGDTSHGRDVARQ